jgi:hypothetical protein
LTPLAASSLPLELSDIGPQIGPLTNLGDVNCAQIEEYVNMVVLEGSLGYLVGYPRVYSEM